MNEYSRELMHHGIEKQRWGVKNGPPYPLDRKTHSRVVTGKQDRELKRYKRKKEGISHLGDQSHRRYLQVENFDGVQRKFSRDGQEFIRTFRGIGDANLASVIARGGDDERAWRTLDRPGHRVTSEDLLDVNIQRRYVGPGSDADGALDAGLSNNCSMCSASLFLRGLGYDVQAGRAASGCKNTADEYWFDGARTYKTRGAQALYKQLQSFGNQGKGTIGIRHKNGSGHSVYFQMEKDQYGKLKPVVYDGQIAKRYGSLSEFLRAEQADMSQFTRVTRLDGSTPNWKHLAEDGAIRANFADESRKKVIDTKTGTSYYAGNFRFANPEFDSEHREEIARAKSQFIPAPERPWITSSNPTIEQTQREAQQAADARALLKELFGIT